MDDKKPPFIFGNKYNPTAEEISNRAIESMFAADIFVRIPDSDKTFKLSEKFLKLFAIGLYTFPDPDVCDHLKIFMSVQETIIVLCEWLPKDQLIPCTMATYMQLLKSGAIYGL